MTRSLLSLASTLLLAARADIVDNLKVFCPDVDVDDGSGGTTTMIQYNTWSSVDWDDWYWGFDWADWERNSTDPISKAAYTGDSTYGDGAVYPAGFRAYTLPWYNQPPICMVVPESHDKKVEILMESDTENAKLCLHDASDASVDLNAVGSVSNCGNGKVYACFTAATAEDATDSTAGDDFGFYAFCNGEGCEQSDITVRMRIRISVQSWDQGKTNSTDDLERWCEYERGTTFDDVDLQDGGHLLYTYPSDLLPDEPSKYPFHILHLLYRSDAPYTRPTVWLTLGLAALTGLVALL